MAIHDRLPVEHFVETSHTYFARCSCGWVSRGFSKEATATTAFDAHAETHALTETVVQ